MSLKSVGRNLPQNPPSWGRVVGVGLGAECQSLLCPSGACPPLEASYPHL